MNHRAGLDRSQTLLFPERLEDYVAAENPVRFPDTFVAVSTFAVLSPEHRSILRRFFRVKALALSAATRPKAVLKPRALQTLRDGRSPRTARSVWSAGGFTAAVLRHEAETPRSFASFPRWKIAPNNPLALFIRWQTSILDFACGLAALWSWR